MQVRREPRQVVAVVGLHRRQHEFVERVQVEPLLRRVARHVRVLEPDREEPRLFRRRLRVASRPTSRCRSRSTPRPSPGIRPNRPAGAGRASSTNFTFGRGCIAPGGPNVSTSAGAVLLGRVAVVEDLPAAECGVAVLLEPLEERRVVFELLRGAEPRRERVHAGGGRPQSGEDARARRVAQRRLTVRVGERGAACCEPVKVRRLHLRVPAERPDPVVQVVDRDEQDVRLLRAFGERREGDERDDSENAAHGDFRREPTRGDAIQCRHCARPPAPRQRASPCSDSRLFLFPRCSSSRSSQQGGSRRRAHGADEPDAKAHWAFKAPVRPAVPAGAESHRRTSSARDWRRRS